MKKSTTIRNIDSTHSKFIYEFEIDETEIIPKLMDEKEHLKKKISKLKGNQIDEYVELKDKITDIKNEIKSLKLKKKKYFLDNSEHLFNYFEDKKNISTGDSKNVNVLNSFFKLKEDNNVKAKDISKSSMIQYWKNVTNEVTNPQDFLLSTDLCIFCNEGEMIPQEDDGVLVCNNSECSKFITHIADSSKPLNKEPPHLEL